MPLEAVGPMMRRAVKGGYAVGYFESWNLESLQGVVDAAEHANSPIILGFNGAFLSGPRGAPGQRPSAVPARAEPHRRHPRCVARAPSGSTPRRDDPGAIPVRGDACYRTKP